MHNKQRLRYGLAYATILGLLVSCISGSQYLLNGSLYDVWIPLLSSKAMADGMALYQNWHSPLGIIYHGLHYAAYLLINAYPNTFHQLDQLLLAGMGFSVLLGGLFMLLRASFPTPHYFPPWVLLLSISIACQLRSIGKLFSPFAILWSGAYNNQGWALLVLVCAAITRWQYRSSPHHTYVLALGLAVATTLGLHFKISIGLALLLWSLATLGGDPRGALVYACSSIALQLMMHLGYPPLSGYWYDIAFMLHRAHPQGIPLITRLLCLAGSIAVLTYLSRPFIYKPYTSLLQTSLFALGTLVAVQGESQAVLGYYGLLFALICALDDRHRYRTIWGRVFLAAYFLCNMLSLATLAYYKHYTPHNDVAYIPLDMTQHTGGFIVEDKRGLSQIHDYLQQASLPYDALKIATHTPPPHTLPIAFHNLDYAAMLQAAVTSIGNISNDPQDIVVMLGFTNPLPLLLQHTLPPATWHWLDFAVNLSANQLDDLIPLYQQTDFMYLPLVTFDDAGDPGYQQRFTQHFLHWNQRHHRFVLIAQQPLGLLYASEATQKRYHLPSL